MSAGLDDLTREQLIAALDAQGALTECYRDISLMHQPPTPLTPVGYVSAEGIDNLGCGAKANIYPEPDCYAGIALYNTHPRAPVALSDERIMEMWSRAETPSAENDWTTGPLPFARAIIAAMSAKDAK